MVALVGRLRKTVTVTAGRETFNFAAAGREVAIDTTLRVAADGRILGFGHAGVASEGLMMRVFDAAGTAPAGVDEVALVALCRRGFALVVGPWSVLRPRVVVRHADRLQVSQEIVARALRKAGAGTVEFAD